MKISYIRKIYDFYSGFYDIIYGPFLLPPLKKSMEKLGLEKNLKILDIGVGTGATLRFVPEDLKVIGIDISNGMIKKAKKKFTKHSFAVMDAMNLGFKDNIFDIIISAYVVTVVPDPKRMLEEISRVLKPEGKVLIVSHFRSKNPVVGFFEKLFDPLSKKMGWRLNLKIGDVLNGSDFEIKDVITKKGWIFWKGYILKKNNTGNVKPS